uniref:ATP synthase subunit 8 n=1 Tax=Amblyomma nitidum TaxID=1325864 RepID=UPI0030FE9E24
MPQLFPMNWILISIILFFFMNILIINIYFLKMKENIIFISKTSMKNNMMLMW